MVKHVDFVAFDGIRAALGQGVQTQQDVAVAGVETHLLQRFNEEFVAADPVLVADGHRGEVRAQFMVRDDLWSRDERFGEITKVFFLFFLRFCLFVYLV